MDSYRQNSPKIKQRGRRRGGAGGGGGGGGAVVAMPDVQNFFHKALAAMFVKVQYLYFRRKLSASSIE